MTDKPDNYPKVSIRDQIKAAVDSYEMLPESIKANMAGRFKIRECDDD